MRRTAAASDAVRNRKPNRRRAVKGIPSFHGHDSEYLISEPDNEADQVEVVDRWTIETQNLFPGQIIYQFPGVLEP